MGASLYDRIIHATSGNPFCRRCALFAPLKCGLQFRRSYLMHDGVKVTYIIDDSGDWTIGKNGRVTLKRVWHRKRKGKVGSLARIRDQQQQT